MGFFSPELDLNYLSCHIKLVICCGCFLEIRQEGLISSFQLIKSEGRSNYFDELTNEYLQARLASINRKVAESQGKSFFREGNEQKDKGNQRGLDSCIETFLIGHILSGQ